MAKYLIEVDHDPNVLACARVVQVFLSSGSHFLTHADWGCHDGVHKAWMIVEVGDKEEAEHIVPAAFREQTKIICLNKFTMDEIEQIIADHR